MSTLLRTRNPVALPRKMSALRLCLCLVPSFLRMCSAEVRVHPHQGHQRKDRPTARNTRVCLPVSHVCWFQKTVWRMRASKPKSAPSVPETSVPEKSMAMAVSYLFRGRSRATKVPMWLSSSSSKSCVSKKSKVTCPVE